MATQAQTTSIHTKSFAELTPEEHEELIQIAREKIAYYASNMALEAYIAVDYINSYMNTINMHIKMRVEKTK